MSAKKDTQDDDTLIPVPEEDIDGEINLDADLLSEDDTDLLETELLPEEDEEKHISEDALLDDLL